MSGRSHRASLKRSAATSPTGSGKTSCCIGSPPDSPGYQERKEVMDRIAITANPLDVPMENLPASLQYHINMTRIVTGLNLGPKLQFVYPLEDLLSSIADPSTIVQVKLPQVRLFIEYIEHGSMPIYASALAWVIVEQFASKLESFQNELRDFSKWTIHHRIHIAEWLSMILNALSRFSLLLICNCSKTPLWTRSSCSRFAL